MAAEQLEPDFIYMPFKRGHNISVFNKPFAVKNGMPIGYVKPSASSWKDPIWISDHARHAFLWGKFPKSWEADFIALQSASTLFGKERFSKIFLDYAEIEALLKIPNLHSDINSAKILPIYDFTSMPKSILKDSTLVTDWGNVPDLGLVTSGIFTVGPSGDDYLKLADACADVGSPLVGALEFQKNGNYTDTSSCVLTETFTGFTFKITNNSPHNGNPNAGNLMTFTPAGDIILFDFSQEGGTTVIEKLNVKVTASVATQPLCRINFIGATQTIKMNNLLLNAQENYTDGITIGDVTPTIKLFNIKFWDFTAAALNIDVHNLASKYENLIAFSCGTGFDLGSTAAVLYNMLALDNTTGFANHGSGIGRSCVDTGTTATGFGTNVNNTNSVSATDEVKSLDDANDDFLNSKSGGESEDEGHPVMILENTAGSRGNARPH